MKPLIRARFFSIWDNRTYRYVVFTSGLILSSLIFFQNCSSSFRTYNYAGLVLSSQGLSAAFQSIKLVCNQPMTPLKPHISSYSDIRAISYSITPQLPPGISLDPSTGNISGTPTSASPLTNYTLTSQTGAGPMSIGFELSVVDGIPNISLNAYACLIGKTCTYQVDASAVGRS